MQLRVQLLLLSLFVFFWLYEWGWLVGVFKATKNDHFLVFLAVWVSFPKFLGRLRSFSY